MVGILVILFVSKYLYQINQLLIHFIVDQLNAISGIISQKDKKDHSNNVHPSALEIQAQNSSGISEICANLANLNLTGNSSLTMDATVSSRECSSFYGVAEEMDWSPQKE